MIGACKVTPTLRETLNPGRKMVEIQRHPFGAKIVPYPVQIVARHAVDNWQLLNKALRSARGTRMQFYKPSLIVAAALLLSSAVASWAQDPKPRETDPLESLSDPENNVAKLFRSFRDGSYAGADFPKLRWDDIPDLLELGRSERWLTDFPRNPLSSQFEERCCEGVVAVWLIEGIRGQKNHFASLNAIGLKMDAERESFEAQSAANRAPLLKCYQEWWARVEMLPPAEAAQIDPLKDSGFYWH